MRSPRHTLSLIFLITSLFWNSGSCRKISNSFFIKSSARAQSQKLLAKDAWQNPSKLQDVASWQQVQRGGASQTGSVQEKSASNQKLKMGIAAGAGVTSLWLLWTFREHWMGIFNKDKLQAKTLDTLHGLNALPKYHSFTVYVLGMAVWEALGLSTIPVETAAGMVFGWNGFFLSAGGKLLGAVLAFCLARYGIFADWIQRRLSGNSFLELVHDSAESNPLTVTVLMKFSCFPETIKNYGSAILKPIRLWMFVFATMFHGWTFSALWTYLGVDTAMRLEDHSIPADTTLQTLLSLALINGVVVSPLSMAYWVKNLKLHAKNDEKN